MEKIRFARKAKKSFSETARHCRVFHKTSEDFWKKDGGIYSSYMSKGVAPKFQFTFCKVFEAVAIFGPLLYYKNPHRQAEARTPLEVIPDLFEPEGGLQPPEGMPPEQVQQYMQQMQQQVQQRVQQVQQQQDSKHRVDKLRASVLTKVLNHMPREQPGGGLYAHARRAVQEAIVTGRGCLWTELYDMPGDNRKLAGSFFDTVDNLLIDPDCRTPDLSDAYWICREVTEPTWVVERRYNLPPGALKGHKESTEAATETPEHRKAQDRRNRETHDLITYYRIFSKSGIGFRHQNRNQKGNQNETIEALDKTAGDFVHLVIAPGVPYPLNLPGERLAQMMGDEEVKQATKWPVEHWRDKEWPVTLLDFYEDEQSPWPIAPLKPALGEIVFVNVMMSALANRIYDTSKDIIAVLAEKIDDVKAAFSSDESQVLIELDNVSRNINEVIQVWQNRNVQFDVWRIIDEVMKQIEKRTGLTDLVYGISTTQDRSAQATSSKAEQSQIRPDDMSAQVEKWQQKVAAAERLTLHTYVSGEDLMPLLGQYGASVWDQLIKSQPVEFVLREVDVTIEAGTTRKPNKAREVANLEQMVPALLPVLQGYAQATTNTGPLNELIKRMFASLEMDGAGLQMGPLQPPPPPPEQMQQQQQQQTDQMQAERASEQMQMQAAQMEHQFKMQIMGKEVEQKQMELQFDQQSAQLDMNVEMMKAQLAERELMNQFSRMEAEQQMQSQGMPPQ
jgi:hypothetical protein